MVTQASSLRSINQYVLEIICIYRKNNLVDPGRLKQEDSDVKESFSRVILLTLTSR